MDDESFANLEELLVQKKSRLHEEIQEKQQKVQEIENFIRSGKEGSTK